MEEKQGFWAEFKAFISRGNVMDMAVGIIVGSAFTAIVNSLVNQVIMPLVGMIIGGINFSDLKWVLKPAQGEVAEVAVAYGAFLQQILNFLIIAFVVFCMVKLINSMHSKKKAEEAAEEETEEAAEEEAVVSEEVQLLSEIRDLLKNQK